VWELQPAPAQDSLSELVRYSLLDYTLPSPQGRGAGGEGGRYHLHDLARLFAASRLSDGDRAAGQSRHAAHYEALLRAANELYMQGDESIERGLALFDLEWPNVQAGQAWAAARAQHDDAAAHLCNAYPDAGAYCLGLRQHSREQIHWLEAALAAARRLKHRAAEGAHLGNLGNAYADLGEVGRAVEYYEQALAIAREIGDRRGEGNHSWNLGLLYEESDPARAAELMQVCVDFEREIGHPDAEPDAARVRALLEKTQHP